MSVRTKGALLRRCTFAFVGPDQAEAARTALQALGFVEAEPHAAPPLEAEASPPLPWREAFPPFLKPCAQAVCCARPAARKR